VLSATTSQAQAPGRTADWRVLAAHKVFVSDERGQQELVIDAEYVHAQLADVVKDEDLSRYIL